MKEVIITVKGGVAEVYSASPGIKVKIVDFDIEGESERALDEFKGSACVISKHESAPVPTEKKNYWIIVRTWEGVADRVWLFDDDTAALSDFKDLKDKLKKGKEDIQIFEVEL